MYLATAAFTGILVFVDSKLSGILNRATFMSSTIGFLLLNLLAFWWLVKLPEKWVPATFYIWLNFFNYMFIAHFWSFANDFFNPREAKRLYGLILSMGTLGGITGGLAADLSVSTAFKTEDVLLIAGIALLLSIVIVRVIEKRVPRKEPSKELSSTQVTTAEDTGKLLSENINRRHLHLIGAMIVLAVIVSTVIDYQFNSIVENNYVTKFARTEFFGEFFALLNAFSLVIQFFLTGKILKRFGIGVTLILVPIILSLGSLGFMFFPTILLAGFLKITDKTFTYSLMQSSRELLFLPIPSDVRVKAKLLLDVFVNRLASGVAAGLIILFTVMLAFDLTDLSILSLIVLVAWIGTTIALRKEYLTSIKRLLIRRDVDIEERVIETLDAETVRTLIKGLHSKDNQKVRYSLSLLELVSNTDVVDHLLRLLQHWDPQIRAQTLRILFKFGRQEMVDHIMPLMSDDDIEVRTEAIHFVWAYCDPCPSDRISEFLEDPEPKIRGAMLASLVTHTGKLSEEGQDVLKKMIAHPSEIERIEAARVLGMVAHGLGLHDYLIALMRDSSSKVQEVAIESAGKVLHQEFVGVLISKLGNPRLRKSARRALANYGNQILPQLRATLHAPQVNLQIRKGIPRVFYQIQTEESWDELIENLEYENTTIRFEIIKSMNKIRKCSPEWKFDRDKINHALMIEIRDYYWKLNIFHAYARKERLRIDVREVDDILHPALQEKLDESLERIFRMLALIYPQQDIYNSYYYITQGDQNERANAIEYLDNLLPGDLKVPLLPILDDIPLDHKVRQGRALFNLQRLTRKEALKNLLNDGDFWLQVCTVYSLGREKLQDFEDEVREQLHSNENILKETAERTLEQLEEN